MVLVTACRGIVQLMLLLLQSVSQSKFARQERAFCGDGHTYDLLWVMRELLPTFETLPAAVDCRVRLIFAGHPWLKPQHEQLDFKSSGNSATKWSPRKEEDEKPPPPSEEQPGRIRAPYTP
ncbi:uncharacterized protein CIMG_10843 [Coccidioides immitis RS]|uniref:Uncharacterized protein n=1 Tax=Coccidioides immitis (strain RS) TaxID=246410 RepID=A0A0D8JUX7_COCIM|nr:uncharacterized protein CIMG_10843 [Coccidioides immitis RS]KJF60093.1 hypothetical protein CIMG_10843 [Coccidioides immitis RS]